MIPTKIVSISLLLGATCLVSCGRAETAAPATAEKKVEQQPPATVPAEVPEPEPEPVPVPVPEKEPTPLKDEGPVTVSRGFISGSEIQPELKKIPHDEKCPAETLCIRASYLGEPQLARLSIAYPDLIQLKASHNKRTYLLKSSVKNVRLRGDVLDVGENIQLIICGQKVEIHEAEVQGTGLLDTSGRSCNRANAGDIEILSPIIGGTSTEKGLKESLILLSVHQTLRNKGQSSLPFFLSKETSIRKGSHEVLGSTLS